MRGSLFVALVLGGVMATTAMLPSDDPPIPSRKKPPETQRVQEGVITGIRDGDTIMVSVTNSYPVRLIDCWAPEVHGVQKESGLKSKANLQKFALGQPCVIQIPEDQKDLGKSTTLGRYLGYVWVHGTNLSDLQVSKGFAGRTKEESVELFGPYKAEE